MVVVAEILTGPLFHVRLPDGATVSDLKKEICSVQEKQQQQQQQLPQDRLILVLDGGGGSVAANSLMCENEAPLAEYGVRDGSHVYIFFTLPESADDNNNDDHGSLSFAPPTNLHT